MKTILDAIGDTPLLNIEGIFVKMEYLNPSGSIKARIAKYMIDRAEKEGLLKPGDTIVEASSGNTGNAMSMVAAVKGYKMLVVMPEGLSQERTAISRAFGAEVRTLGDFHVNSALDEVRRIAEQPGFYAPQQFDSEWNVIENHDWLGQEILKELPTKPDLVIVRYWLPFMGPCLGSILRIIKKNNHTKVVCIADNIIPHEKRIGDTAFTKYFVKPIDGFITMSEKVLKDLNLFSKHTLAKYVPHPLYDNFGEKINLFFILYKFIFAFFICTIP